MSRFAAGASTGPRFPGVPRRVIGLVVPVPVDGTLQIEAERAPFADRLVVARENARALVIEPHSFDRYPREHPESDQAHPERESEYRLPAHLHPSPHSLLMAGPRNWRSSASRPTVLVPGGPGRQFL